MIKNMVKESKLLKPQIVEVYDRELKMVIDSANVFTKEQKEKAENHFSVIYPGARIQCQYQKEGVFYEETNL